MANIGQLTVVLGVDVTQLNTATKHMNTFAQRIRTIGYLTSATLTAPIIAAGKAAVQLFSEYEYTLQKIVGLTGTAQEEANQWTEEIKGMAREFGKMPQELLESLYFIASSGIHGSEALDVLAVSTKAAAAGLGDTQVMADLVTSALNAYANTGLTASKVTDTVVASVREGKAEASGFASAMGSLIPIAANMGVSFEQIAGAMAAITLTGASASNAAVYLKGVLNALLTAADQGKDRLKELGTSYGELRYILQSGPDGLIKVMQRFRDIQMELGDEAIKDVLPNIRALTGYMSIAGRNFQYNTELINRVVNSSGDLNEAWMAVADTVKIQLDRALVSVKLSMMDLGKAVIPTFIRLLNWLVVHLENLTERWNRMSDAQKEFRTKLLLAMAAMGPFLLIASSLIYVLSGLVSTIGLVVKGIKAMTVAMMANPYTAALIGILALANALVLLIKRMKEVRNEYEALDEVLAVNDTAEDLKNSIVQRMNTFDQLNLRQLTDTKNQIEQFVALKEDEKIRLQNIDKERLRNDWWVLQQREKIRSLETALYARRQKVEKWSGIKLNDDRNVSFYYKNLRFVQDLESQIKVATDEMQAHIQNTANAYEYALNSIDPEVALFESHLFRVNEAMRKQQEETDKARQSLEEYLSHIEKMNEFEDEIDRLKLLESELNKLGITYDATSDLTEVLQEKLKYLIENGYKASSLEIRSVIRALRELGVVMYEVTRATPPEFTSFSEMAKSNTEYHDMIRSLASHYGIDMDELYTGTFEKQRQAIEDANNSLSGQSKILDGLAKSFEEFFYRTNAGFQGMVKAMLDSIKLLMAKFIGLFILKTALGLIAPGSNIAIGAYTKWFEFIGPFGKGAKGGIVPSGYNNDTYPALLSSGEAVLNPLQLSNLTRGTTVQVELTGDVRGSRIGLALRRTGRYV